MGASRTSRGAVGRRFSHGSDPAAAAGVGDPPTIGTSLADSTPPARVKSSSLRDLRISVTDRYNFRCVYCMPKESFGAGHTFLPRASLPTFEDIARVARLFAALGVTNSGSPVASPLCAMKMTDAGSP